MAELTRLALSAPDESADLLLALLAVNVPHGWEERSLPTGQTQCIVHSDNADFLDELTATLRDAVPGVSMTVERVQEQNWAEAWKEFFTPVPVGEHFLVLPPWLRDEPTSRIPILIEPKMAFGTGHHATTALCLETVSLLFARGVIRPGMRFLDLGTGSGILGLACAKLGLSGVGLDIDPTAVDNALENRELNAIAPEIFTIARGGIEAAGTGYDLVLANILAAPLRDMAREIVSALARPGGLLVLSGMLDIQADSVEAVYRNLGLPAPERLARDEWVALIFQ